MTAPTAVDLHVGTPTLTDDLDIPVARRTPAVLNGHAVETVTVPIRGVDNLTGVDVSVNGGALWRATVRVPGGVQFIIAGAGVDEPPAGAWVLPTGCQLWVFLRVAGAARDQVRQSAQPIVTLGPVSDLPVIVNPPLDDDGFVYGHGAPGDMSGVEPGVTYVDLDTGDVYEWSG